MYDARVADTSLEHLTPDTRKRVEKLLLFARRRGIPVQIISTHRRCQDQDALYAQGRTSPGSVVTGVRGCRSWHTWGRAVDLAAPPYPPRGPGPSCAALAPLGRYWKTLGGVWGGDWKFKDCMHFEYHPSIKISEVCPTPGVSPCPSKALLARANVQAATQGRILGALGLAGLGAGIWAWRRLR